MNVLLFGGTTEGRTLSEALVARGEKVTVCVATDYGREEQVQVEGVTILTGRKGPEDMRALLPNFDLCIDATHPYATEVTKTLKSIAEETGVKYIRIRRALTTTESRETSALICHYASPEAAAEALKDRPGNVLLATGTKELAAFRELEPDRLFPRVLPSVENLQAVEALGIPRRNIIAMQGPFSTDLNVALLKQKDIKFFVTKDGGKTGGFPEKAEAAKLTNTPLLVIAPPDDEGVTVEEFLEETL
ncbi:MAG: precorrin-6A reductase [Clostridia bacterium]|nr:precorrin-6A reductase [Clostridia bacterium]